MLTTELLANFLSDQDFLIADTTPNHVSIGYEPGFAYVYLLPDHATEIFVHLPKDEWVSDFTQTISIDNPRAFDILLELLERPMVNHKQAAIDLLLANGWINNGQTESQAVRVPTAKAPVFGGIGGEVRIMGGRLRLAKGDRRVTVGSRTTCFYTCIDKVTSDLVNVPTKDLVRIGELA